MQERYGGGVGQPEREKREVCRHSKKSSVGPAGGHWTGWQRRGGRVLGISRGWGLKERGGEGVLFKLSLRQNSKTGALSPGTTLEFRVQTLLLSSVQVPDTALS